MRFGLTGAMSSNSGRAACSLIDFDFDFGCFHGVYVNSDDRSVASSLYEIIDFRLFGAM